MKHGWTVKWCSTLGSTMAVLALLASPVAARPEVVSIDLGYAPGTVVIVNSERKVYYITGASAAISYNIAIGKESELWTGRSFVSEKKVDPRWIPVDGTPPVAGGDPSNPLGQRALYLDWSLLRIHGTPSRGSIGRAVSNGCIRMLNEDVIDLYDRVHVGAPVFAINSRRDAGAFKTAKVADLIYVNPDARLDAKAREAGLAAERQLAERYGFGAVPYREQSRGYYYDQSPRYYSPPRYYGSRYRSGYGGGWW